MIGADVGRNQLQRGHEHRCVVGEAEHKSFATANAKGTWVTEQISDQLSTKRGFRVFKDFGLANPSKKYPILLDAARESGVPEWRCPAIETLLAPTQASARSVRAQSRIGG